VPTPFDPRLVAAVAPAVAKAAMDAGVARQPKADLEAYRTQLQSRLDATAASLQLMFNQVRANPRRVVFAEGEEEKAVRAALQFRDAGYGTPILLGREDRVRQTIAKLGLSAADDIEIHNARLSDQNQKYTEFLYKRLQRRGHLYRDCQRMVNQDRNVFAASLVACGDADAMVTGLTRSWTTCYRDITQVLDPKPDTTPFGLTIVISQGRRQTLFIADSNVNELPTPEQLADIAVHAADEARQLGHEPKVALLSFSNFGNPWRERAQRVRDAVAILDTRRLDFEYDGELTADMALDPELRARFYPFSRLTGAANVLVMPALHSAHISARLLQVAGGGTAIGPLVIGLSKSAQIVQLRANVSDLVTAAAFAAHDSLESVAAE
jgi:malate dehydrogenase (oxaloacetate-decarboxylating)(NADP+)